MHQLTISIVTQFSDFVKDGECECGLCIPGVLLLDLEASDLPAIVNAVVDKLVLHDVLLEQDRGKLMRTLLLKHK